MVARCLLTILLVALWPLVHFANYNREQLDGADYLFLGEVLAVTIACCFALFIIGDLLTRRGRRVALVAALGVALIIFFNYHGIYKGIELLFSFLRIPRGHNYLYVLLGVGIPALCLFVVKNDVVITILLVFGLIANVMPAAGLLTHAARSFGLNGAASTKKNETIFRAKFRPNVYYIIADAYARNDVLQKIHGYDNSRFIEALKKRGFYTAEKAYSNYPITFMSIASTLEMNYLATEESEGFASRGIFYDAIRGDNLVVQRFRAHGYRYAHLGAWSGSRCGGQEDKCLSGDRYLRTKVLQPTPIGYFINLGPFGTYFRDKSTFADVMHVKDRLDDLYEMEPFFLFAHTMPPHPPGSFGNDCRQNVDPGIADWNDKAGYIRDVECVNSQFIALVDSIIERDADAIVILQGDHGTSFGVDHSMRIERWPFDAFHQRFGILLAVRVRHACREKLYPSLSPVNIFRVILPCLTDETSELLPDISYVSAYEKHEQYGQVYRYRSAEKQAQ